MFNMKMSEVNKREIHDNKIFHVDTYNVSVVVM